MNQLAERVYKFLKEERPDKERCKEEELGLKWGISHRKAFK